MNSLRKSIGVVHCYAHCDDCGAVFEGYVNGQALAAQHAKRYGHTVRGEVGLAFEYIGEVVDDGKRGGAEKPAA